MAEQRLGVMGGMFDPVHEGHLAAARLALRELSLDYVHLVPCAWPNHRDVPGTPAEHRVAMLELAIQDESNLLVDLRELQRPGVSYMVDTLRSFVAEFPQAHLVYILGQDSFYSLPSWHQWRELLDLCHLAVINRPTASANVASERMSPELADEFNRRQVNSAEKLFQSPRGRIIRLNNIDIPASSTAIRHQLAQGERGASMPQAVVNYINHHGLYRSGSQEL